MHPGNLLCPAFPPPPAPRTPDMQFQFDSSAAAQSPESSARRTLGLQGPALRHQERMHTLKWAAPRRNLVVPRPLPCGEQDVDRRRVDPGEAPKLEPLFGLHHCPLPPAQWSEEQPLPRPFFQPWVCKRLAGSAGGAGDRPQLVLRRVWFSFGIVRESAPAPPCPSLGASCPGASLKRKGWIGKASGLYPYTSEASLGSAFSSFVLRIQTGQAPRH